ncbi:14763_t:CDS:2 [Funneliformis geosporum]|uniref:14763_t:CDS:1 n=1 Tax=Funneliformis geosporum TaxID=1117311 RepID=A0A9W4X3U5_9GLOM|nr:14763_t:CDS:2 [Funneliformis geosporum]
MLDWDKLKCKALAELADFNGKTYETKLNQRAIKQAKVLHDTEELKECLWDLLDHNFFGYGGDELPREVWDFILFILMELPKNTEKTRLDLEYVADYYGFDREDIYLKRICQAEVQVSEAQFYKSKGHCKSCYYVRFEKPKLMKKIFKEINKKNKMNITNNNYCLIDGDGSRDLTPCVGCKKLVEDRYLCSEVESREAEELKGIISDINDQKQEAKVKLEEYLIRNGEVKEGFGEFDMNTKNENKARKDFVKNYIENKETKELKDLEKSLKVIINDLKNIVLSVRDKKFLEQTKAELKIVRKALSEDKKLEKLIAEVEQESYRATYDIVNATYPLPNVFLIKDEIEPLTSRTGFFPEQDTDFRITLRNDIIDYYGGDEDDYHQKLLTGEITPREVGEAVATLYVSKVFNKNGDL